MVVSIREHMSSVSQLIRSDTVRFGFSCFHHPFRSRFVRWSSVRCVSFDQLESQPRRFGRFKVFPAVLPRVNFLSRDLNATVAGFVGALCVFALLFWGIDGERFIAALGRVRLDILGAILLVAVCWLTAWSLSLRTVLGVLGVKLSVWKSFLLYASALFANNVTPFGQAGGEPVAAVFISRLSATDYETSLASIASVDAIHLAPSITFALLGLSYYAIFVTVGQYLRLAAIVVVTLAIVVPVLLFLAWRYRYTIERRTIESLTPLFQRVGRIVPRLTPPSAEAIERRIESFFTVLERIATDRRGVLIALFFSALGWLVQMCILWLAFVALGQQIPFFVVLFTVPVANIASIVPFPGGLGAIETVFVVLLVSATPVATAVVAAAVLIHRTIIYTLPVVIGGSTAVLVSTRSYATK